MELTHGNATRRLAELKRQGVVKALSISAECLTVRVARLSDDARFMVGEALAGTSWTVSIADAKPQPEPASLRPRIPDSLDEK